MTVKEATESKARDDGAEIVTVTIDAACRMSGLSRQSIYRAINSGCLKATKVCGRRLVFTDSLRAFLERGAE